MFHVKLDTGMGRLGVKDVSEYKKIIETIDTHEHLIFEGVFTHFACADEPGDSMNQQQHYKIGYLSLMHLLNFESE